MNQRIIASIFVVAVSAIISAQAGPAISETGNERAARQYYGPPQLDQFGNPVGQVVGAPVDAYGNPIAYQAPPPQPQTIIVDGTPSSPFDGAGILGTVFGTLFG